MKRKIKKLLMRSWVVVIIGNLFAVAKKQIRVDNHRLFEATYASTKSIDALVSIIDILGYASLAFLGFLVAESLYEIGKEFMKKVDKK